MNSSMCISKNKIIFSKKMSRWWI